LLALVDNGTVGLDDPASTYLPQMTGIGDVTLRQLCQNTSGIGDYSSELASQFVNNPLRQWATLELVTDGMGVAAPGSNAGVFSYSNAGIILLGMALQSASGQSWSQLYQKYVFDRVGMTNTSFPGPTQTTIVGTHPHGYATELTEAGALTCGTVDDVTDLSPSMAGTAGGVISSLPDLKAYSQALAAGALPASPAGACGLVPARVLPPAPAARASTTPMASGRVSRGRHRRPAVKVMRQFIVKSPFRGGVLSHNGRIPHRCRTHRPQVSYSASLTGIRWAHAGPKASCLRALRQHWPDAEAGEAKPFFQVSPAGSRCAAPVRDQWPFPDRLGEKYLDNG